MATGKPIRIGTRGSPLALWQAEHVRDGLKSLLPELSPDGAIEIVKVKATGDQIQDRALAEVGGKGLFTKELDIALLEDEIDIAVHSAKDVPTWLPEGIIIAAILEREDPRDVLISRGNIKLSDLPEGATVGTASLRRQSQLLHMHPHLNVTLFRGNVQTRLRKLEEGEADATMLALAGLKRMDMQSVATEVFEPADFLPAVAQGALAIGCREDRTDMTELVKRLDDPETHAAVVAERAMLETLDGSCRTPIAGLAVISDNTLHLDGLVAWPDGRELHRGDISGPLEQAEELGRSLGTTLRAAIGEEFFALHADEFGNRSLV